MSKVLPIVVAVFVFVVIMQGVDSQCSYSRSCEYLGISHLPREEWRDNRPDKCLKCSCSESGTKCCRTTVNITVLDDYVKCINVVHRCRNKWVIKWGRQNRRCPGKWMPRYITEIGKK